MRAPDGSSIPARRAFTDVVPRRLRTSARRAWFRRMLGSIESRFPQRSILAIDALVILWTIAWVLLGVTVGLFVERLGAVGEGLEDAGRAIVRSGDSVDGLSDVPLVGEGFATLADEIRGLGRDTAGGVVRSRTTSTGWRCSWAPGWRSAPRSPCSCSGCRRVCPGSANGER